jgi:hypothetical protein
MLVVHGVLPVSKGLGESVVMWHDYGVGLGHTLFMPISTSFPFTDSAVEQQLFINSPPLLISPAHSFPFFINWCKCQQYRCWHLDVMVHPMSTEGLWHWHWSLHVTMHPYPPHGKRGLIVVMVVAVAVVPHCCCPSMLESYNVTMTKLEPNKQI